jgi:hypothetical protein
MTRATISGGSLMKYCVHDLIAIAISASAITTD